MTKKIALISSFCDTEQKIDVLNRNLDIVKNLGIDIMVISPFSLPKYIEDKCDYFFKTKDNPVLDWPERSMFDWIKVYIDNEIYQLSRTYPDYGWAGLFQVKQLSEIALLLKYEQFFHMIYDLKINENVLNGLKSEKKCNIYPSKRDNEIWKVGLHFMIFDKKNLSRFVSNIHLDGYLNMHGGHAFKWLENLYTIFPYNIEEIPVEDEIYFHEGKDFYNYSPTKEFSMFVVKDDELKDNIKLLFYNVLESKKYIMRVNGLNIEIEIKNYTIFDLGVKDTQVQNVEIVDGNIIYDITKTINQIKHNTLRKC